MHAADHTIFAIDVDRKDARDAGALVSLVMRLPHDFELTREREHRLRRYMQEMVENALRHIEQEPSDANRRALSEAAGRENPPPV